MVLMERTVVRRRRFQNDDCRRYTDAAAWEPIYKYTTIYDCAISMISLGPGKISRL